MKVEIAVSTDSHATCDIHGDIRPTCIGLLYGRDVTSDLFYDDCLDWNHARTLGPRNLYKIQLLFTTDG